MAIIHWIVIVVLVLAGIFVIRLENLKYRFFIIILILLALFLYSSIILVTSKNDLDLSTSEGIFTATRVYSGWLANGFHNLKTLTGNAVNMDWTSTNRTFFEKTDKKTNKNQKKK